MSIAVCVKWVDLRPEIDLMTGEVTTDVRRHGFSDADQAALELGLALAADRATDVVVLAVAPAVADTALRELAAAGAASIVRIDGDMSADATGIGAALAAALDADIDLVITGDYSLDRGSGSVPAFIAHQLGWAQALGLIGVAVDGTQLTAVRRLDGGRREHLRIAGPAVLSVEGSVAKLRRASMRQVLASRDLPLVVRAFEAPLATVTVERSEPLRPRARSFPAPHGDRALQRIVELTGALVERTPPRRVEAAPAEAAAEILTQLRRWGYLD